MLVSSFVASFIMGDFFFYVNKSHGFVHFKSVFIVHVAQWWIIVHPIRPTKGGAQQGHTLFLMLMPRGKIQTYSDSRELKFKGSKI